MAKQGRVHFLTLYLEYLYDQGIKSEDYYLGDASRYLRFLLSRTTPEDFHAFLANSSSHSYKERLTRSIRKFHTFAHERLGISSDNLYPPPAIDKPSQSKL